MSYVLLPISKSSGNMKEACGAWSYVMVIGPHRVVHLEVWVMAPEED